LGRGVRFGPEAQNIHVTARIFFSAAS